ncbi:glycosyltransferase family 2 protein [Labedella endophytica]|uniref:Glycosyltransferase family 2 protein n=1 Tax=Labedella endophytica TaxID=1523160 RepID=A0A433JSH8_9MICO|nr:glycosyltransferase family 2 protein [Labedella endophytica]RUR01338.1 glycosyltransferase family 2 protein [Labedella endophytica]
MSATVRPITIVVPVYGDLPSLLECVDSVLANVDLDRNALLLVNDVGPDADAIERALLDRIDGVAGARYERNPRNLGFVGNCNRAATELDTSDNDILLLNSDTITTPGFLEEMSGVLHASDTHGVVCARSNNATIVSIPHYGRVPKTPRTIERTAAVHSALKDRLPRFSISPVAHGFCFLVRRELIRSYGLFDEIYAPGYGEENDFCLRVNAHGHLSLIANRALVFHAGSMSFDGEKRMALRSSHEKIVVSRYPFYTDAVQQYLWRDIDPVDHFADAMMPGDDVPTVFLDVDALEGGRLPADAERIIDAARERASATTARFTLSVPDAIASAAATRYRGLTVVPHSQFRSLHDIGVAIGSPDSSAGQLLRLNRSALRWMYVNADPAHLRRWDRRDARGESRTAVLDLLSSADVVVSGSDRATAELRDYLDAAPVSASGSWSIVDGLSPEGLIDAIIGDAWTRDVDVDRLRTRWFRFARPSANGSGTTPSEPRLTRLARKAQSIAPVPTSFARRAVKALRRRLGR